jgi:hypothetical protein
MTTEPQQEQKPIPELQKGQRLTTEEKFYSDWAKETIKNNITLCNDVLKQLISVSSAILGLTIIFEKVVVSDWLRTISLLFVFLCLIISLIGLLPYEQKIQINSIDDIKAHKKKALKHKRQYLWTSAIFLVIGFGFLLGQFIIRLL